MAGKDVFTEALGLLENGEKAALSTIVSSNGSLPMSKKAKMLVRPDGKIVGTVGGGCLEADVWAEARRVVESEIPSLQKFILTEKHAGEEGLNCGGNVEIFTEPLLPGRDEALLKEVARIMAERGYAVLATLVAGGDAHCKLLIDANGTKWGGLGHPEIDQAVIEEFEALDTIPEGLLKVVDLKIDGQVQKIFLESICPEPTLYLFGGGHVSYAIAQIAHTVGFRIVVIDDRPMFANRERFPMASETLTLDMDTALDHLVIDELSYIVAVTRGHQHDKPIIRQAVKTNAGYVGMIGSRRKTALMWKDLEAEGISRILLDGIHSPIGLDIGADTPEEIAVSVVGELIQVRRQKGKPAHEVVSSSSQRAVV
ncbi:MAG: xanthine dehydrogenase accessory factor [Candidatus Latescibacterota bacterium]|jgi:xanthine dehydrogenase accessory factor